MAVFVPFLITSRGTAPLAVEIAGGAVIERFYNQKEEGMMRRSFQKITSNKYLVITAMLAALLVLPITGAHAGWVAVEIVTIDGVANALPGGQAIYKTYGPGTYQFVLLGGNGISYNVNRDFNYVNGCFIMALEQDAKPGIFHSIGLSEPEGRTKEIISSSQNLGVQFFIQDWGRSDNAGTVKVSVRKWQ